MPTRPRSCRSAHSRAPTRARRRCWSRPPQKRIAISISPWCRSRRAAAPNTAAITTAGAGDWDDAEFEVVEVVDRSLVLSEWRRPDGGEAGFQGFPFDETELCPPDAFEELTPDEQHFHEATGNEGASFERTYRRAGLVLWPRTRRLAVLNQAGLGATLPHLEDLTRRWEASDRAIESPLWREADELSGHMLRSWSRQTWREEGDTNVSRMLDLQGRLGNVARIDGFLAELSAEGHYAALDNEAIVRAAALLPRARATDLLVRIVARNAPARPGACSDLLLAAWRRRPLSQAIWFRSVQPWLTSCRAIRRGLWNLRNWARPTPLRPGFVVALLTATSQIDAGLAARAIEHLLAWPKTYEPDDVLVPAALAFAGQAESATWPAVRRLRDAALEHLRRRIALPLDAPRDWARINPLECTCSDCRELGAFLLDPHQRQWRLKAIQHRRSHVEGSVRNCRVRP